LNNLKIPTSTIKKEGVKNKIWKEKKSQVTMEKFAA
jgi:hypothetical protein